MVTKDDMQQLDSNAVLKQDIDLNLCRSFQVYSDQLCINEESRA